MKTTFQQLSFSQLIPDQKELHEFIWGENALLKFHLEHILEKADDKFVYIWGNTGSGKSHLLQTICHQYDKKLSSIYLPLSLADTIPPSSLDNLEQQHIVTLDDIHLIRGRHDWEEAIFHLYNRIRDKKDTLLIIAGNLAPNQIALKLPDLVSRLQWGMSWQLKEPSDEIKLQIIMQSAVKKGFYIPETVGQYLLSHYSRNLNTQMEILDILDNSSLQAQRRTISIPFIKECLKNSNL
jgi:DnaA family protein